ncbi:MAG TPA: ATP-binding protein [Pseudonocardia sp.]|nr:ATP-binding protein [Pseudonocardia sp.]
MARALGWLRARMGVRVVSALSAAVVVALALMVAGAALVLLVQQSLRTSVRAEAEQQAQLITNRLAGNWEGESNENAREAISALTRESDDLAQVLVEYGGNSEDVDRNIVIEAGTDPVGRDAAISDIWPDVGDTVVVPNTPVRTVDGTIVDAVLVASGTESDNRHVVLLYAAPLTGVDHATDTVLFYLLWGVPLLIVVAGVTTYLFSGRALRPVEAIRTQVAAMTEKDLAQRVPVPPARDEVGRLAETMNAMIARLQDAQGVQRRFVADASHELRSPLATIATGLELMQNATVDRGTVTALRGETTRLNKLVEGLILLARADERGLQPRRDEVDLDEVAEGERGRPADGAVVAEVRAMPVRVVGDRGQLARVVRNLVDNARRHARSRVLVTVGRQDDTAVIEVSDDGPGVPPADRARVFERFVRLDDARARSDGGSGLGLAIVSEVVAAHGGTVEVADAPGGGALFRVRLPAAAQPEAQPDEPAPAEGAPNEAVTVQPAPAPRPSRDGKPGRAGRVDGTRPDTARPDGAQPASAGESGGAATRPSPPGEPARAGEPGRAGTGSPSGAGEPARAGGPGRAGTRPSPAGEPARAGAPAVPPGRPGEPAGEEDAPTPAGPRPVPPPRTAAPRPDPVEPRPNGRQATEPTNPRPAQPADGRPGTAPARPVPVGRRPVRDDEARRDPATAPRGIPAVTSEGRKAPRGPVPAPRPQH